MTVSLKRTATAMLAIVIGAIFATAFETPASAATLYYKVGTHVTHAQVFSGSTSGNMVCFTASGIKATMCVRQDRETIYVRSDAKNGYFKLGQIAGSGRIYRCQNNYKQSSGQNTWVACHWNWPNKCYVFRTGQGQADWFTLSYDGPLKCF
jgi:hypothetical protein